jgi:energy-coupling factor transporter ATP-binding protein EcfA2
MTFKRLRLRGRVILVVGPDGTGKSTLCDRLETMVPTGVPILRSTRPGVMPGRTVHDGPVTEPHKGSPYPRVLSTAKVVFEAVDALLGWALVVRPVLRRDGYVILERGWWDLVVDPLRYRLSGVDGLVRILGRIMPRADLVVILAGDPIQVVDRKAELSVEETARQMSAWAAVLPPDQPLIQLDASLPPEVVAALAWSQFCLAPENVRRAADARVG